MRSFYQANINATELEWNSFIFWISIDKKVCEVGCVSWKVTSLRSSGLLFRMVHFLWKWNSTIWNFVHFQRSEIKMANWTKSLMINLLLYSIHIYIHSSICWTSQPAATLSFVSFNFNHKTSPPILILDKTSMNEVEKNLNWRIFWTIIIVLILWKWLFLVLSTQAVLLTSFFLPVALPRFIRHLFQDNFKKRVFKKK